MYWLGFPGSILQDGLRSAEGLFGFNTYERKRREKERRRETRKEGRGEGRKGGRRGSNRVSSIGY